MPLCQEQVNQLSTAIIGYDYPRVAYNFQAQEEIPHESMRSADAVINAQLLSDEAEVLKDGLSNILYWGQEFQGFHDEKLRGAREGQRSSRLSDQFRVIYTVDKDIVAVFVMEITPHKY